MHNQINELLWTPFGHVHPLPTYLDPQYIYIHHFSVQIVHSYYNKFEFKYIIDNAYNYNK